MGGLKNHLKKIVKKNIPFSKKIYYGIQKPGLNIRAILKLYSHFHTLNRNKILITNQVLHALVYDDLYDIHYILSPNEYNQVMEQIFSMDIEALKAKDKIKLSFVLYDSAMWCGDLLYHLFDDDPRFDVNIILSRRRDITSKAAIRAFEEGVRKLRQAGLKVTVVLPEDDYKVDSDILFFLTPYLHVLHKAFQPENLAVTVLVAFVTYGLEITKGGADFGHKIRYFTWHEFADTQLYKKNIAKYEYRGDEGVIFTGYPRMDTFYVNNVGNYKWKMVSARAKKFIWAPHWSINDGYLMATFQKNYKWFFDYAQKHPFTTSWVVKPHPNLMDSAIQSGIFKTENDFQSYLDAWDNLPNAKVETGAYYQDIFKTSDAMILDSASFTGEYQYVHKPELFLMRGTDYFNKIGHEILNDIYKANGDDFTAIQSFIDGIISGECTVKSHKAFDCYLDYYHINGKLASEGIYEAVIKEIEGIVK